MREFELSQGHKELERQLTESFLIVKLRYHKAEFVSY